MHDEQVLVTHPSPSLAMMPKQVHIPLRLRPDRHVASKRHPHAHVAAEQDELQPALYGAKLSLQACCSALQRAMLHVLFNRAFGHTTVTVA